MKKAFNIQEVSPPDMGYFALLLEKDAIQNLLGVAIDVREVITEYGQDLTNIINKLKSGQETADDVLFVPDLWHVALGRARCFTQQDGHKLWETAVLGIELGTNTFLHRRDHVKARNHPGSIFYNDTKNIPAWVKEL